MTVRKIGVTMLSRVVIEEVTFGDNCWVGSVVFVSVVLLLSGLVLGGDADGGDSDTSPLRKCLLRMRRSELVFRWATATQLEAVAE